MKEYLRCSKVLFFSFEFCWSSVTQMSLEEVRKKNQWLADLSRFFTGTCICLWHVLADTLINHNMKKNSPQCRSCLILTTCWFFLNVKSKFWFAEDRGVAFGKRTTDCFCLLTFLSSYQSKKSELRRTKDASAQNPRRCISYFFLSKVFNLVCLVLYVLGEVYINYSEYTKRNPTFVWGNVSVVLRWFSLRWFPLYYAMSCWWKMTPQKPILSWATAIAKTEATRFLLGFNKIT